MYIFQKIRSKTFIFWNYTVHQFQDPKLNVSSAAPTAEVRMTAILLLFLVN
jgi:hypothetical protein